MQNASLLGLGGRPFQMRPACHVRTAGALQLRAAPPGPHVRPSPVYAAPAHADPTASRRRHMKRTLIASAAFVMSATIGTPAAAAGPTVEMTWMSIANWYFKIGDKRIMMDAYITRVPESIFVAPPALPNDKYAYTRSPHGIDTASIAKVRDAVLGSDKLDLMLAGHAHFDHTWDTPTWSKLTGAPMVGSATACLQAAAQGVAEGQCRSVSGGETISLGDGLTMRVVRFNHSGDATNPIQHFARELYRPPVPDPATGGYRAGVGEDYPNGGGNRAFLFTIDRPEGKLAFFVNNSASAYDLDKPIVVDGVDYGSPLSNLAAALKDAGLTKVDAWIGTGGKAVAEKVVPVLHPKVYIPSHWDGLFNAFWPGMPYPFKDDDLQAYLKMQSVELVPQRQYFDKYVLTTGGVSVDVNHEVKGKLGFADQQRFSQSLLDAVSRVASTSVGDDCGEGFAVANGWAEVYAQLRH
jgi:L-ascorbate metabolism protein UlaG (beta-lactamase superfamily)